MTEPPGSDYGMPAGGNDEFLMTNDERMAQYRIGPLDRLVIRH